MQEADEVGERVPLHEMPVAAVLLAIEQAEPGRRRGAGDETNRADCDAPENGDLAQVCPEGNRATAVELLAAPTMTTL